MLTGPSIKDIDFNKINISSIIGVNGAYRLDTNKAFAFYVLVDLSFIKERSDIIADIIADNTLLLFISLPGLFCISQQFDLNKIKCKVAIIEDIEYKIFKQKTKREQLYLQQDKNLIFSIKNKNIAFSTDIRKGIFDADTVAFWALQIIVFLGFNKIYIAGLDMNNFEQPRFYETNANKQPSFLQKNFSKTIYPSFLHAAYVFKQKNIQTINLSTDSAIGDEVFTRMSHLDAFK